MAIVTFENDTAETVLVCGVDEAEIVERYRHGVS